jgi:hypothetical protein
MQPNALLIQQNFIVAKSGCYSGEAVMAEPMGCSVKLRWLNCGIVWVQLRWLGPTRHKRWLLGGCNAHTGSETLVGTLQAR